MKLKKENLILYAVTDRSWLGTHTLYEQAEEALKGGATMIQLREKELDEEAFEKEARKLRDLCHSYQVPLIINDNVELAARVDADGVHIGQEDMQLLKAREILGSDKIIGVTAKTVEQAKKAQQNGADYLGSGAVFGSTTKKNAKPMELSLLKEITESVDIPVAAIGGIDRSNVLQLKGTGIAGIAVVSGIFAQEDICGAARELLAASKKITKRN